MAPAPVSAPGDAPFTYLAPAALARARARSLRGTIAWRGALRAVLPAWLLAHAVVLTVCVSLDRADPLRPLFAWDTEWYLAEANAMTHGGSVFGAAGGLAHFFPLTPLCVAGLAIPTRLPVAFVLIAFCWISALLFGVAVYVLAVRETGSETTARRAAALSQLAPGGFALVMGYTEPLADLLAVGYFLAVRRNRTVCALAVGLLAGASRPTGVLLALPGLIEALRAAHRAGWDARSIGGGIVRTAAPVLGLGTYLGYCQIRFHRWLLPYSQQTAAANRGAVAQNPLHTFLEVITHHAFGILVTSLACAAISVAGVVACHRRLALSFTAWSAPMLVLGVTSPWFTSEPRYLAAIFPTLIALPMLLRGRRSWYTFLGADLCLLAWVCCLALGTHQVA